MDIFTSLAIAGNEHANIKTLLSESSFVVMDIFISLKNYLIFHPNQKARQIM
jgi:hypothetical protein